MRLPIEVPVGTTCNTLTVTGEHGTHFVRCVCACAAQYILPRLAVHHGRAACKTCTARELRSPLGKVRTAVHNAIARCADKTNKYYGGRGIKVYGPWVDNPAAFLVYLMTLPDWDSLVLDRIDNNGHYEPGNLRFVTWSVSNSNKRRSCKR